MTITVTTVNDDPVANDDTATVAEDTGATRSTSWPTTTTAPIGETLTVTARDPAHQRHGQLHRDRRQLHARTPTSRHRHVHLHDQRRQRRHDTATVNVTVTNVNDAPIANDDSGTVAEDSSAHRDRRAGQRQRWPRPGETLTVTAVTGVTQGSQRHGDLHRRRRHLHAGRRLLRHRQLHLHDQRRQRRHATRPPSTITVTNVNDDPVANDDTATVAEDSSAQPRSTCWPTTPTAPSRRDADGHRGDPARQRHGQLHRRAGVSYTPDANFFGTDTFTYTISDGNGGTATATVNVTVTDGQRRADRDRRHGDGRRGQPVDRDRRARQRQRRPGQRVGETLTVTGVTQGSQRHGDLHRRRASPTRPTADFFGTDSSPTRSTTTAHQRGPAAGDTATVTITVTTSTTTRSPTTTRRRSPRTPVPPRSTSWPTTPTAPDAGETLTVTAVTQPRQRHGHASPPAGVSYTPDANFYGADRSPTRSATATAARPRPPSTSPSPRSTTRRSPTTTAATVAEDSSVTTPIAVWPTIARARPTSPARR